MDRKSTAAVLLPFLLGFAPLASAVSVYIAEVDVSQSYAYIGIEPQTLVQLSGSVKITVDNGTILFENIDLQSTPSFDVDQLLWTTPGPYDGSNFSKYFCDYCIGNGYWGTFDTQSLALSSVTFGYEVYDYTIVSSSITSVPLPSTLLLLSSAMAGMLMRFRKPAAIGRI